MRSYQWWHRQKTRVRKKYKLFLSWYLSPKEVNYLAKQMKECKRKWRKQVKMLLQSDKQAIEAWNRRANDEHTN